MTTEVDICNLALANLGDIANITSINPPEGAAQAAHCARFYPIARDNLLASHAWGFATFRSALAELDVTHPNWTYVYSPPSQALSVVSVVSATSTDPQPYGRENISSGVPAVLTDVGSAYAVYTKVITDTAKFPPLFVSALSWSLAAMLAGPVIKGKAGAAKAIECQQTAAYTLGQAKVADANQQTSTVEHTPDFLSVR